MILYVCEQCGRWQDVSIGTVLSNAWNSFTVSFKLSDATQVQTPEQQGVPCPQGRHGLMRLVTADERLRVWKPWNQETDHVTVNTATEETPPAGNVTQLDIRRD